jgi:hypothetical protein
MHLLVNIKHLYQDARCNDKGRELVLLYRSAGLWCFIVFVFYDLQVYVLAVKENGRSVQPQCGFETSRLYIILPNNLFKFKLISYKVQCPPALQEPGG